MNKETKNSTLNNLYREDTAVCIPWFNLVIAVTNEINITKVKIEKLNKFFLKYLETNK